MAKQTEEEFGKGKDSPVQKPATERTPLPTKQDSGKPNKQTLEELSKGTERSK